MGGSDSVGSQEGSISRNFVDRVDESQATLTAERLSDFERRLSAV